MAEHEGAASLVERVLREARVPPHRRAALRRELLGHFEDAAATRGLAQALRAFGDEAEIAAALRQAYRRESIALYVLKLLLVAGVALAVSAAALALASLRLEDVVSPATGWRLAPGFGSSMIVAAALVTGVLAWREVSSRRFSIRRAAVAALAWALACMALLHLSPDGGAAVLWSVVLLAGGLASLRASTRPSRVLLAVAVFAASIAVLHAVSSVAIGIVPALARGAALVATWLATVGVASRLDPLFIDPFEPTQGN